ncbi:hypothetical protein DF159_18760, partial [Burkholderia ubonensis]
MDLQVRRAGRRPGRLLGSVYIRNAHALPRERPLARRATPRILDVSPRSTTRRAAVLVATP